jgi:hypothetical protein
LKLSKADTTGASPQPNHHQWKELKMKLRTFAAVVLGVLASHPAFADPEGGFLQSQEPKVIHAFGLSVPARPAEPDSGDVIHAFGLSVPAGAAKPDSTDGIHAFGLDIHGNLDGKSAQIRRDKPGV